jgi:hypothetical protein
MGWDRYRKAVGKGGWAWYESEVPPEVVGALMYPMVGRSYQMPIGQYRDWLYLTGMDMVYGYVPWQWGRENGEDKWGRFVYKGPLLEVGDLIGRPPYEEMRRRLEELCGIKGDCGVEWALYNTPQLVIDGLGMEKFFYALKDTPERLHDWMERIDERVSKELEVALEYPVEVVQISQPMCDKNGPMVGSGDLGRFFLDYLKRRVDRIHGECRLASLHCDGNNQRIYDRLRGVDVFNGYDGPHFPHDYKLCPWGWRGTVPTALLETGRPEEVKEYVKSLPPCVIGSEDMWQMPVENFKAMMEAARELQSQ